MPEPLRAYYEEPASWNNENDLLNSLPPLTEREWAVMNVCWKKSNLTVQDVISEFSEDEKKHYQTVKKQLEAIVEKGYLIRERKGNLWLYSPKFRKRDVVFKESKYFIENITGSDLSETYMDMLEKRTFHSIELKNIMEKIIILLLEKCKDT